MSESDVKSYQLNDRHADEPQRELTDLLGDFAIGHLRVANFVKLPFFNDCLRSAAYKGYAQGGFKRELALNSLQYVYQPADIIIIQEGFSQLELNMLQPIITTLREQGYSTSVAHAAVPTKTRRILSSAVHYFDYGDARRLISASRPAIMDTAERIRRHFGLSDTFTDWFAFNIKLAYYRYVQALRTMKQHSVKPKLLLFSSEHHGHASAFLRAARELGIPTVLFQHGFLGQEWTHFPIESEKVCVFGEVDRAWYLRRGLPADRVVVTGAHRAFAIDADFRRATREKYGIDAHTKVITFFAPNLTEEYHRRASAFLRTAMTPDVRAFIRPHPRQDEQNFYALYRDFVPVPQSVSLKESFALSDLVLHDYSTMCYAEYSGLHTATLELDAPYPPDYARLIGDQPRIENEGSLQSLLASISPGYDLNAQATPSIACGGEEALRNICAVVVRAIEAKETR